jgi:predicted O-linked N-acetylglucosamine transferase (SPINDLY family)
MPVPRAAHDLTDLGCYLFAAVSSEPDLSQSQRALDLHQQGVLALASRDPERAVELIGRAIELDAADPVMHFNQGVAWHGLGRWERARRSYEQAIALEARFAAAHSNCGLVLEELGLRAEALRRFELAVAIDPHFAEAHFNRGVGLHAASERRAALESYERAIAIRPRYAEALFNRGNLLRELGRPEAALASYDRAIAARGDYATAHANRGNVLRELGRREEALASYDRAIELKPDDFMSYSNRGNVERDLRRFEAAFNSYRAALALKGDSAEAHCNLGVLERDLGRWTAALASFDRAVALDPTLAQAHFNRADILCERRDYAAALASFDRALSLKPDLAVARGARLHARLSVCDWAGIEAEIADLTERLSGCETLEDPCRLLALCGSTELQRMAAERWTRGKLPPGGVLSPPATRAHDKIRIGYFSADFRVHPVASLIAELIETHDRDRFEIFGFSLGADTQDPMRLRLTRAFDRFFDVRDLADAEVVRLARSHQVDIAIDLNGFTEGGRSGIFATRAAPIQIGFLGYPGTCAAPCLDYLVADRTVAPNLQGFAESLIYMPDSFMPNDSRREIASVELTREVFGLPPGFVFVSFNAYHKITPQVFDVWMSILRQIAGSVLWLQEGEALAMRNLRLEARRRGVVAERIVFAPRMQSQAEHLARHRLADLFLDTLPYNAHSGAMDALYAGLPLLTCAGEAFAARVAASLLTAARVPELITSSLEDYEARAVELAADRARLARLARRLEQARASAPLFDAARFRAHLEAALCRVHAQRRAGRSPQTFDAQAEPRGTERQPAA